MSNLIPRAKPGQPVLCGGCQHEFSQDPPFFVFCKQCGAKAGQYCKRPSEHSGPFVPFHAIRDIEALKHGFYDHAGSTRCGPNSDTDRARKIIASFSPIIIHPGADTKTLLEL